jgi:hypothetical protein
VCAGAAGNGRPRTARRQQWAAAHGAASARRGAPRARLVDVDGRRVEEDDVSRRRRSGGGGGGGGGARGGAAGDAGELALRPYALVDDVPQLHLDALVRGWHRRRRVGTRGERVGIRGRWTGR